MGENADNTTELLKELVDTQKEIREDIETIRFGDPEEESFGDKAADWLVDKLGSWSFIISQSLFFVLWILWNTSSFLPQFDRPPFVGFNLILSLQAAYSTAFVLIAQKRMSSKDQRRAIDAYRSIMAIERKMGVITDKIKEVRVNGHCEKEKSKQKDQ